MCSLTAQAVQVFEEERSKAERERERMHQCKEREREERARLREQERDEDMIRIQQAMGQLLEVSHELESLAVDQASPKP